MPPVSGFTSGLTSARYFRSWVALLGQRGHGPEEVLAGSGLSESSLQSPSGWLSQWQVERVFENGYRLTGDDGLGVALGLTLNLSSHGPLGFAGLASRNTREAMLQMVQYMPLVTSLLSLSLEEPDGGDEAFLELAPRLGVTPLAERYLVQTVFGSLQVMTGYLHGDLVSGVVMELAMPPSAKAREYFGPAADRLVFDAPRHRLRYPRALLERALTLADEPARLQALRYCEEEMATLARQAGFAGMLYQQLIRAPEQLPSLDEVAALLHVSTRTVHRRLKDEGQSFRELLRRARITLAKDCLLRHGMDITRTAHHLGYQDSANFTRAFRRAEGMTPSEFVRRSQSGKGRGHGRHRRAGEHGFALSRPPSR